MQRWTKPIANWSIPAWDKRLEGKEPCCCAMCSGNLSARCLTMTKIMRQLKLSIFEADFTAPFTYNGKDAVWLYGIIDRVDKLNDTTRIVDYKTGKVEERKPSTIEDLFSDPKFKASFQTFYYGYLYSRKYVNEKIITGLYPLQKFSAGMKYYKDGEAISNEEFKAFDKGLAAILSEIFNAATFLAQTARP